MDLITFQGLALRNYTLHHMIRDDDLVHCVLGLCSELSETFEDGADLVEELGDLFNYLAVGYRGIGDNMIAVSSVEKFTIDEAKGQLVNCVSKLADGVKRRVRYNDLVRFGDRKIKVLLDEVLYAVLLLCRACKVQYHECLTANIAKLAVRYPLAYSDLAANARADKGGVL